MPYVERVTKAGNTIEIERYFTSRYKKKGISRGDKVKPTKEEQEKVNTRQAERKLRILINANYGYGDYHLVLMPASPPFPCIPTVICRIFVAPSAPKIVLLFILCLTVCLSYFSGISYSLGITAANGCTSMPPLITAAPPAVNR